MTFPIPKPRVPRIAAILTEYRPLSHADVLITKLLEGYDLFYTRLEPGISVASIYTDQVPANDLSREMASRHGVPIYPVERTLLVTGILDAVMTSRFQRGRHLETPHLNVTYAPPGLRPVVQ